MAKAAAKILINNHWAKRGWLAPGVTSLLGQWQRQPWPSGCRNHLASQPYHFGVPLRASGLDAPPASMPAEHGNGLDCGWMDEFVENWPRNECGPTALWAKMKKLKGKSEGKWQNWQLNRSNLYVVRNGILHFPLIQMIPKIRTEQCIRSALNIARCTTNPIQSKPINMNWAQNIFVLQLHLALERKN